MKLTKAKLKEAIRKSIDERWKLIRAAKSCKEMIAIDKKTSPCPLCVTMENVNGEKRLCGKCVLNDNLDVSVCCIEYREWTISVCSGEFRIAVDEATSVISRLERELDELN